MDITDHKRAENALGKSQTHLQTLVETIPDLIWLKDPEGVYLDCNAMFERFFGAPKKDIIGKTDYDYVDRELSDFFREHDRKAIAACKPCNNEEWLSFADGGYHGLFDTIKTPMLDADGNLIGVLGIARDITERKIAEENIKAALQEKEVLLREIHHRVKNNMQVISSLLFLQAARTDCEQAQQSLLESQQRIHAMSMVHEVLYSGQNLAAIDLSDYLKRLVDHLQGVYSNQTDIRVVLEADHVEIDINQAVPCSLIFNELITNAFKHAFPDGRKGTVRIRMYLSHDKEVVLELSDNGVGFVLDQDLSKPSSLGLKLIRRLLMKQLKGRMDMTTEGGTTFTLRWPLPVKSASKLTV
jgi:PAS domain S-box-containing protein